MSQGVLTDGIIDAVFDDLDTDGSGTLSLDEILSHAFPNLKIDLTPEQEQAVNEGREAFTKEEFREYIHANYPQDTSTEMMECLKKFDPDGNGYLDWEKMMDILTKHGDCPLEEEEAKELLDTMDINKDGRFNIFEMVSIMYFVNDKEEVQEEGEEQQHEEEEGEA